MPPLIGRPAGGGAVYRTLASVLDLQRDFGELAQDLSDAQADFDLGDEYVIEEFGRVEGASGRGEQSYGLIVWPARMTNLRNSTAAILEAYLAAGGLFYGVRPAGMTIDGQTSNLLEQWKRLYPDRCSWFPDSDQLLQAVLERVQPRLMFDSPPETGLAHMRRLDGDSELFVVVNSSPSCWRAVSR